MKQWIKDKARKLAEWLLLKSRPEDDELVMKLILHTASLELPHHEWIDLAPLKGCCGPIRLTGNSLPVFEYRLFEKKLMEFIKVRVEVAKPDRISFITTIDSTTAPERHGEEIETEQRYKEVFFQLAMHLLRYFPYMKQEEKKPEEKKKGKKV